MMTVLRAKYLLYYSGWPVVASLFLLCSTFAPVNSKICSSLDVRNNPSYFSYLEGCHVIEGNLQILLHDDKKLVAGDYENKSFPELTEITGYLLLYRVPKLTSLSKLFPNLSVIRGRNLFSDYALVVYEMSNLQEIGLSNLTVIERGSVRIERNPSLCFTETIDWSVIVTPGTESAIYIRDNKPGYECPKCQTGSNHHCPTSSKVSSDQLCWKPGLCQRICHANCSAQRKACFSEDTSKCCHPQCIGGCTGPTARDCWACKHVDYNGECLKKCPTATFSYLDRRCVSWSECQEWSPYDPQYKKVKLKPFDLDGNARCIEDCPPGYKDKEGSNGYECARCIGPCPKVCQGGQITNIAQAQKFKGCNIINGALEITVGKHATKIVEELEKSLKDIEVIRDYLKIVRSAQLITLHFFKKLRTIKGENKDREHYSLLVFDNINLQELFPWNPDRKLEIEKGKVFFHWNQKLCLDKIEDMKQKAIIRDGHWDEHDVSRLSNGDRMACNFVDLQPEINVMKKGQTQMAMVYWNNFQADLYDFRALLGYMIYYREAEENVTMFEGMDACGTNTWTVRDKESSGQIREEKSRIFELITGLKAFTRYALYIKTYTVASETRGGVTDIQYFYTSPDTPMFPIDLVARSQSHNEISLEWKPPKKPNGIIAYYKIRATKQISSVFRERDYCDEPVETEPIVEGTTTVNYTQYANTSNTVTGGDSMFGPNGEKCCSCGPKLDSDAESDGSEKMNFENYLQDAVYVKRENRMMPTKKIHKRAVDKSVAAQTLIPDFQTLMPTNLSPAGLSTEEYTAADTITASSNNITDQDESQVIQPFEITVPATELTYRITNLTHFTRYEIEVIACQNLTDQTNSSDTKNVSSHDPCSMAALATSTTLPKAGANDLTLVVAIAKLGGENNTSHDNVVEVRWEEPAQPNGVIVSYQLEYKRHENDKLVERLCITRSKYLLKKGVDLIDLPAGNYSLRLRSSSTGGVGDYSNFVQFVVPDGRAHLGLVISMVIVAILVTAVAFMSAGYFFMKKKFQTDPAMQYVSFNPDYIPAYTPDEWEIAREKVQKLKELGQGSFGAVYEGLITNHNNQNELRCAIKTVNDNATAHDRWEFLKEASVMKEFRCYHVVQLLGVVSQGQPAFVCMELMAQGDLKSYLRKCRPEESKIKPPSLQQLYKMAAEIADGMAYLAAKKFVHRDLAGRNCMVAADLTVKIGDFGMTRDIYETDYYRKGNKGLLPVRWMAPESLRDGVFTNQSDVWSYGIVLWEMVTLASQPYQGLTNEDVLKFVTQGRVMVKPEDCPERIYVIMSSCWARSPKARPKFDELIEIFTTLLTDTQLFGFKEVSWYHTVYKNNQVEGRRKHSVSDSEDKKSEQEPFLNGAANHTTSEEPVRFLFPVAAETVAESLEDLNSPEEVISESPPVSNTEATRLPNGVAEPIVIKVNGKTPHSRPPSPGGDIQDKSHLKMCNGVISHQQETPC
ncbi:Insulin receptor [Halotydeus destructor]|nr:Insulin receptor [Halotydeus destructor]